MKTEDQKWQSQPRKDPWTPRNGLLAILVLAVLAAGLYLWPREMGPAFSTPVGDWPAAEVADVCEFGAKGDGLANDTPAIQAAIDRIVARGGGRIRIPAGVYLVDGLRVYGSGVLIVGDGSAVSILRRRPASPSANVLEFGETALGNEANTYERNAVYGLTFDGNRERVEQPLTDLTDWGLAFTKCSLGYFGDIEAMNCWNGGVLVAINSNFNRGSAEAKNCGRGNLRANGDGEPGFDVNSSKNNRFLIRSENCRDGARLLDNCADDILDVQVRNAEVTGFIYNNQPVNESHNNHIHVAVDGGCAAQGVSIGANARHSTLVLSIRRTKGAGVNEIAGMGARLAPTGNTYVVSTAECAGQSCIIGGNEGSWTIRSRSDGRAGPQGAFYAIDILGMRNRVSAAVTDESSWQVRGISLRRGATENIVDQFTYRNIGTPFDDAGQRNRWESGPRASASATPQ